MVQTSVSVQTKVLLVTGAALATGLAAYALGYYDYDWRLAQQPTQDQSQQQTMGEQQVVPQPTQPVGATLTSNPILPDAVVGQPYETRLTASTGANTRWALEQGALPSGLTLDEARGVISGTATLPAPSLFRLKFGNNEQTGVSQFTLNVVSGQEITTATTNQTGQTQITTDALPNGQVGKPYQFALTVKGDTPTGRVWRLSNDAPLGLELNGNGEIVGTPKQMGTFLVSVVLTTHDVDRPMHPYDVVHQYALVITPAEEAPAPATNDAPLKITTNTLLPAGRVGVDYSQQLTATGGPANSQYYWKNLDSVPGLSGNGSGLLKGVPTSAGVYNLQGVTVSYKNAAGAEVSTSADFKVEILPKEEAAKPTPNTDPGVTQLMISGGYPDGGIGYYYMSNSLQASGGQGPFEWRVASGNIPSGLSFSPNSQIAGYANQYGIFTFIVEVRDQSGRTARAERTISIRPSQPVISASVDPDLSNRLRRIDLMGVQVHDLIKLQDDGNPDTQYDTTVYYVGADGRRHSFPNPKVYFTWFPDFSRVRVVAPRELADIPLGANLTYRPGTRLVKFATDPRVYAVDSDRRLRWVKTESVAQAIYGPFWARQVDDVSDAFYMDYRFGQDIDRPGDYSTSGAMGTATFPSDVLPR
jgi:hypothetical protein